MNPNRLDTAVQCLANGGECGTLLRACDFAGTPLGIVSIWPAPLQAAISLALASPFPAWVLAGPEFMLLYNDAAIPLLGPNHPRALAQPGREGWPELWSVAGAVLADVRATARPARAADLRSRE